MRRTTAGWGDNDWRGGSGSGFGSGGGGNLLRESGAPLTLGLIIVSALLFLLQFFNLPVVEWLAFFAPSSLLQPWRLFTYPVVVSGIIGLLFYCLMWWWIGASLERSWGTPFYAAFLAAMSVITAVAMSLGSLLLGLQFPFPVTYYLPFSALLFAWCIINANEEIRLYGIIPILGKWLAVGTVLIIFFTHASIHPLMGFFALTGCGAALWWVKSRAWGNVNLYSTMPAWRWGLSRRENKKAKPRRNLKLVPPRSEAPPDDRTSRSFNPIRWWKRRQEKKQFEKLVSGD